MKRIISSRLLKVSLLLVLFSCSILANLAAAIPFPPNGYEVEILLPKGQSPENVALGATGSLRISEGSQVKGTIVNLGKEGTEVGARARTADIISLGPVYLETGAYVDGDVISGSAVKLGYRVVVTGEIKEYADLSRETISWTIDKFGNVYDKLYVKAGYRQEMKSGAYRDVVVEPEGTLFLGPGTYYAENLYLEEGANLVVDASRGPVTLYVGESFVPRGNIYSEYPKQFLLGYLGSEPLALQKSFAGTLVAPMAAVELFEGKYQTTIFAQSIHINAYVIIDYLIYIWEWLLDMLIEGNTTLYFSNGMQSTGRVYKYDAATDVRSTLYTRPAGRLYNFTFAPWDPDLLYYVNGNQNDIYYTDLDGAAAEISVYNHTTYVRDIAFDSDYNLYFSEATGAGANGKIYRLNADKSISLYYTVKLSDVGYWAGTFDFNSADELYISNGNLVGGSLYHVDVPADTVTSVYTFPGDCIVGIFFASDDTLYHGTNGPHVYSLNLTTLTHSLVYTDYFHQIWDVGLREELPATTPSSTDWVMPYSIRGIRTDQIKPSGLVDYVDHFSGLTMNNAPFGGTLAFALHSANTIPTSNAYYYRYLYRLQGSTGWNEFDTPIYVRYVKNRPLQTPVFPNYSLGPVIINGRKLYRFRPHEAQLQLEMAPSLNWGESVEWPKIGFHDDMYRGLLNTVADCPAPGKYEVLVEVYNSAGNKAAPGLDYDMIVPTGMIGGTLITGPAPITYDGFKYLIHVDNRKASATVDPPAIGSLAADSCGFLRYSPPASGVVDLSWNASHPGNFAMYRFYIRKGASTTLFPITDEVSSWANGGDGNGNFHLTPPLTILLGACDEAAFAIDLDVYAKATTGNGYRIHQYDDYELHAFAISPF